jgi:hypothetical protein
MDVEMTDMNNDGLYDIVDINNTYTYISVRLATGPLAWGAPANTFIGYPTANAAQRLRVADLNGDGFRDVAAWSPTSATTALIYNNSGTLGAPKIISAGGTTPDLAVGDINNDGAVDLLFANNEGSLTEYLASSPGVFPAPTLNPTATGSFKFGSLTIADFNLDGIPDAAGVSIGVQGITIVGGSQTGGVATGGFQLPATSLTTGNEPTDSAATDLNADGILDLVICAAGPDNVQVFRGNGGFSFTSVGSFTTGGLTPRALAIGDINIDGKLDVITANESNNNISVLRGVGNGTLMAPQTIASGGMNPTGIEISDFDENGKPDAVVINNLSSNAAVLLGNGNTFNAAIPFAVGPNPSAVAAGDITNDKHAEFAAACADGKVYIWYGLGNGTFPMVRSFAGNTPTKSLVFGDANGDGIVDILQGNTFGGFTFFAQNALSGFDVTAHPLHLTPLGLALHDLDGDGRNEVIGSGGLAVSRPLPPPHANVVDYGTGTPGCFGRLGMYANGPAKINNPAFVLSVTNAPASSLGLALVADAANVAGGDTLGIGVKMHIDFALATQLLDFNIPSNTHGEGYAPVPIPNNPILVGSVFFAQSYFVEQPSIQCSPSPFSLVSSRGLSLIIMP